MPAFHSCIGKSEIKFVNSRTEYFTESDVTTQIYLGQNKCIIEEKHYPKIGFSFTIKETHNLITGEIEDIKRYR